MLNSRLAWLVTGMLALLITGCKITVIVPAGGYVVSQSGDYLCDSDNPCELNVEDYDFDDTFTAIADGGFVFGGWKLEPLYFCGGTTDPCRLFTSWLESKPGLQPFLFSDIEFFLEPEFVAGGIDVIGEWNGEWEATNTGIDINREFGFTIAPAEDGNYLVTVHVDAAAISILPVNPSFVATVGAGGAIVFDGLVSDFDVPVEFSLSPSGAFSLTIADFPGDSYSEITAVGQLTGGVATLNLVVGVENSIPYKAVGEFQRI